MDAKISAARGAFVHSLLQGMAGGRSCESTSSIKMQKKQNKKLEYAVRDCLVKMCREIRLDLGSNVQKSDQGDEHIYENIGLSQCPLWSWEHSSNILRIRSVI